MDWLFYLGIIFLPFENFVFAPSRGWAAISPIIFGLYAILNYKFSSKLIYKYRFLFYIVFWVAFITAMNFLFIDSYVQAAILRTISTLISLGLGVATLFAFDIFFLQKKRNIDNIIKILVAVYSISLFTGFIQYLTVKYNIGIIKEFDAFITKRSYLPSGRLQFTFTEPSFIGMHLFGILMPIYVISKRKSLRNLIVLYSIFGFIFSQSVRLIIDTGAVVIIYVICQLNFRKLNLRVLMLSILTVLAVFVGFNYTYNNSYRFKAIADEGIYADGSFSSRFFRINASVKGYQEDFLHATIGYGYGQEIYPLQKGYARARREYKSLSLREVNQLKTIEQRGEESTSYSLYTRIASEGGIIVFLILLCRVLNYYIYKSDKNGKIILLISLYLYLQFESYAFYNIWLVIVLLQILKIKNDLPHTSDKIIS